MANKGLFASLKSLLPRADARNEEGARAYQLPPKHALAQLAATGCFNGTFYAQAQDQLATLLALLNQANVGRLLSASIGNDPSLRDVMRMARPTPKDNARRALFGWLTDKPVEKWAPAGAEDLPAEARSLDAYRKAASADEQVAILEGVRLRCDLLVVPFLPDGAVRQYRRGGPTSRWAGRRRR